MGTKVAGAAGVGLAMGRGLAVGKSGALDTDTGHVPMSPCHH